MKVVMETEVVRDRRGSIPSLFFGEKTKELRVERRLRAEVSMAALKLCRWITPMSGPPEQAKSLYDTKKKMPRSGDWFG